MKVEIKDKVSEINYPCLMKESEWGIIVLFDKYKCGTCIDGGTSSHRIGDYKTSWSMPLFKLFDGEITIKND